MRHEKSIKNALDSDILRSSKRISWYIKKEGNKMHALTDFPCKLGALTVWVIYPIAGMERLSMCAEFYTN